MSPGNQPKPPPVDATGLPPGPRWPVLLQTAGLLRFRHRFHPYMHSKYGDVFTVRIAPGGRPLVFVTRPEHAKEIFAGDPEVFHAGKANGILGPIMGEHSLLLQDGSEHKRARKLLMPAFNGHALREYQSLVTEVARAEVATWRNGEEFRSLDRMNALTLEVILRVVFGVTDESRLAQLRPARQRDRQRQPRDPARLGLPAAAEVRPLEADRRQPARARPADVRRDPRASYGVRPGRAHRRALPADRAGGGRRRPQRHRAPRPARHPAARRPRDDRERAGVGALRGRPRPGAAGPLPGAATRATTTSSRR